MYMALHFLIILIKIIVAVNGALTGQYPLTETCLCVTGTDVQARNTSTGKVVAWLNKASCFLFNGAIDQRPDQAWYQLQNVYGHNLWVSGRDLVVEPTSSCSFSVAKASNCHDLDAGFCNSLTQTFPGFCTQKSIAVKCNSTCFGNGICNGLPEQRSSLPSSTASTSVTTMTSTRASTTLLVQSGRGGYTCHVCDGIQRPEDCITVKECSHNEVCSAERYIHQNGYLFYKLDCKIKSQCTPLTPNGRNTVVCSECCTEDLCGVSLCGSSGYPKVRGPICYNCIYQIDKPTHCGKIKVCSRDELCGVQQFQNGRYEVKCMSKQTCSIPDVHTTCTSCCSSNLCNRDCRLATTCRDEDDAFCQSLLATAPSFCANPTLSAKCNATCLVNSVYNGVPGPRTSPPSSSLSIITVTSTKTAPSSTRKQHVYYFPDGKRCQDELSCTSIQLININYCSQPELMLYCNMTCGFCDLLAAGHVNDDSCSTHPCVHGQCSPKHGSSYVCTCDLGYMGVNCDHKDPCYKQPCLHGQCVVSARSGGYQCHCDQGFFGPFCDLSRVRDCQDVLDNRISSPTNDNIYVLDMTESILGSRKLNAKCEFSGNIGWTVLMHRDSGHLDFENRDSTQYALGFGNSRDEFWTGLEYVHTLTSDGRRYQLRIDLTVANGSHYYQIYDNFMVGPRQRFTLSIGRTSGTAGDSLSGHNHFGFTTVDRDQDSNSYENCANYIGGGWWFHDCADSCLTCKYATPGTKDCRSMSWQTLGYCVALKAVTMKIRSL